MTSSHGNIRAKQFDAMAGMKILFVENHQVFAANVTRQFLSAHEVIVVPTIAEARKARSADTFDLVLVDYDLDDGKGDTFIREIRAAGDCIIIVGVSSHAEGNRALLRAGASAICSKMQFDGIQSVIDAAKTCADLKSPPVEIRPWRECPFTRGKHYRVRKTFKALRDTFSAGEVMTFDSDAWSRYDEITGYFFRQPGRDHLRAWDILMTPTSLCGKSFSKSFPTN